MSLDLDVEIGRTQPDYIVYRPGSVDGSTFDTGNEHFLVFNGPDGSMMAVWTQSSYEDAGDHRIVFSKSEDEGHTWTKPSYIVGCRFPGDGHFSSWAFPIVSKNGSIYLFYNQYIGVADVFRHHTGTMRCIVSRDSGRTWSAPADLHFPRGRYDNPDSSIPPMWIVWQIPLRLPNGRWIVGYTHWASAAVRTPPPNDSWTSSESVIEFMRFNNIDDDPAPGDVSISFLSQGDQALRVPHYLKPELSVAQEPSIVALPDSRLLCVMRTMTGCIWYSISSNLGETWTSPRPLLRKDHGLPILEPLCCCPLYQLADGNYVLLHHNNDGRFNGSTPEETWKNRRPAYIALGQFRPNADQPLWFSESKLLMDNQGVQIGPLKRIEVGVYPSFTTRNGKNVLWHPDRKFFLLGKEITTEFLSDLRLPK